MEDKIKHLISKYQRTREWHLSHDYQPDVTSMDYIKALDKGAVVTLDMVIEDLEKLRGCD